ncbi:ThiF family adenylyltransferase [Nocardioides panacihumi]
MPTESVAPRWHHRLPERWKRELAELDEKVATSGWRYRVRWLSTGEACLIVHYPLDESTTVPLLVEFHRTYPHFAPVVTDLDAVLAGARHRQVRDGTLCLVHAEDWDPQSTVAELIATQLPKLLAMNRGEPPSGSATLEYPAPEPVALSIVSGEQAIIVGDHAMPAGVEQGALVMRFSSSGRRLGSGVVERILGPGVDITTDLPDQQVARFPVAVAGRWIRDAGYQPGESATSAWHRISTRLHPLHIDAAEPGSLSSPEVVEVIGLLVPDETAYRTRGESWVFLLRLHTSSGGGAEKVWRTHYRPTQYLSRALLAERTPVATKLAEKSVVLVGLGAIGMPLATDLVSAGLGSILCVDRDQVDVATGVRQPALLTWAGTAKAFQSQILLEEAAPYARINCIRASIESCWDQTPAAADRAAMRQIQSALASADLVICATANPAVTRFLGQLRQNRPFLTVSGTASGWGGVVSLHTAQNGCWACVGHHRHDNALPVPPADPDGWLTPTRCADRTFRGERHLLHQIALHASAVAIGFLTDEPMRGEYCVASTRDTQGRAAPIAWTTTDLPVHPDCPLHHGPNRQAGVRRTAQSRGQMSIASDVRRELTPADRGAWRISTTKETHVFDLDRRLMFTLPEAGGAPVCVEGAQIRTRQFDAQPLVEVITCRQGEPLEASVVRDGRVQRLDPAIVTAIVGFSIDGISR